MATAERLPRNTHAALAFRTDCAYTGGVKKTAHKFTSFESADAAEIVRYRNMTPQERVDLLLELVAQSQSSDETEHRLERVYRIVDLSES